MMTDTTTSRENLTLTDAELAACRPVAGEGGHVLRALCPFHGSDHQRSLRVTRASGRFVCFACGAWGYLAEARERWQDARTRQAALQRPLSRPRSRPSVPLRPPPAAVPPTPHTPTRPKPNKSATRGNKPFWGRLMKGYWQFSFIFRPISLPIGLFAASGMIRVKETAWELFHLSCVRASDFLLPLVT